MNRLRISLSEKNGEMKGKVESECDAAFMLEALSQIITLMAARFGVSEDALIHDVYALMKGKVK